MATTLPRQNVVIRHPPAPKEVEAEEGYQLLEIPPEILKTVESSKAPIRFALTPLSLSSDEY